MLRVMLVDDDPQRAAWIEECLRMEGFEPFTVRTDHVGLLHEISENAPDIIVIDMASPGRDLLESLAIMAHMQPTPVVMFSAEQDPDFINQAVESGVTAYMVGNVEAEKVKPVIDVAMAQFRAFQQVRQELKATRSELEARSLVERAKSMLMQAHGLTEAEAHTKIRTEAMRLQLKMTEVAKILLQDQKRSIR